MEVEAARSREDGGRREPLGLGLTIVNFGCGDSAIDGYVNVDGSLTVLMARIPLPSRFFGARAGFVQAVRDHEIRYSSARRLSFPKRSLDGFYVSHILEHLSRMDCELLLKRCRDWLKRDGMLRVVLPDLKQMARSYVEGRSSANQFVADSRLSTEGLSVVGLLFGHAHHRWMYDAASFLRLLRELGYRDAEEMSFRQGRMPELTLLDVERRRTGSFYVEARC